MEKILTVEDTFLIIGRGLVIAGWEEDYPKIKIGDWVEIVRPDATKLKTQISGIEWIRSPIAEPNRKPVGLMLKDIFKKEDVPIGSEIYVLEK
ncbi:MAG TPA: hypothetical protein PKY82_07825 [Pyrinomonadaceae bacterium]|nr:hypothetical protein [Pyrinomonadaceae bacterium]